MPTVQTPPARANAPSLRPFLEAFERGPAAPAALVAGLLSLAFFWCYKPTLATMIERWSGDPQYSHGFLVPIFAGIVLWSRRTAWKPVRWQPSWWGLPVLGTAVAIRLFAAFVDIEPLDALTLLPAIVGVVLLAGGVSLLRWSWPAIAFLAFMLPLPFSIEQGLSLPLRRLATVVGTYVLQTLGCPAYAEGNVIYIEDARLGVAGPCSGLGMLLTLSALATVFALLVRRPLLDRLVLVASAVPIAVFANVGRITATGLAYYAGGQHSAAAQAILHDVAGWLMMPVALGLLWLEPKLIDVLLVEQKAAQPLPVFVGRRG